MLPNFLPTFFLPVGSMDPSRIKLRKEGIAYIIYLPPQKLKAIFLAIIFLNFKNIDESTIKCNDLGLIQILISSPEQPILRNYNDQIN